MRTHSHTKCCTQTKCSYVPASLCRDEREAKPFENFDKGECFEVIDKDFKIVHDIPVAILVDIDAVEPSNSSSSVSTDNTSNIRLHPDLVAINLNLYSDETDNVSSNTKCPMSPLMTDCNTMNTVASDIPICKNESDLTESLSINNLAESKIEVEGEHRIYHVELKFLYVIT